MLGHDAVHTLAFGAEAHHDRLTVDRTGHVERLEQWAGTVSAAHERDKNAWRNHAGDPGANATTPASANARVPSAAFPVFRSEKPHAGVGDCGFPAGRIGVLADVRLLAPRDSGSAHRQGVGDE